MDCVTQIIFSGLLALVWDVTVEAGIGCYKCKSMNGSNPACGDPFNPFNNTYYHRLCNETLPPRIGLFPAKYCTKIKGINVKTSSELIVRSCGFELLDNTCGPFMIGGDQYHGCIMSCKTHACNSASQNLPSASQLLLLRVPAVLWTTLTLVAAPTIRTLSCMH